MSKKQLPNRRPLDEIAADIYTLQRSNIFESGELFIEAKESHDGEFMAWLKENEEDFGSVRSAENKMGAAHLKRRFANIATLNVGKTTIYALVAFDKDHPALTDTAISTLSVRTKGARITAADAKQIMEVVHLLKKFGSQPDATLFALEDIATTKRPEPWHDKTTEALKAKRPTTEEAAKAIVVEVLQEHVFELYDRPLLLNDPRLFERDSARNVLQTLARVPAEDRQRVLHRLVGSERPITETMVYAAMARNPAPPGGDAGGAWDEPPMLAQKRERRARVSPPTTPAPSAGEDTGETEESVANACMLQVGQAIGTAKQKLSPEAQDRLLNRLRKKLPVVLPENAEEEGPVRDMFDRMVERLGGDLALEMSEFLWSVQEGHWEKGGESDRVKYADVWDTATYTKYPELNPHIRVMGCEESTGAQVNPTPPTGATEGSKGNDVDPEQSAAALRAAHAAAESDEAKICAQCKRAIKPPELVIAADGKPVHRWCERFWNRDKGGVHYGGDVPSTVPPESASNALDLLDCAVVPGGEP
jgi:hypothetical protein